MRLRHLLRLAPSAKEVRLPPDTEVTFAPMDALADGLGGLDTSQTKSFHELASGSYNYFRDGDLLLAKVTPCFENGKKALAEGLAGGMGFATSEVHVLRPEVGRIDPRFLLYLLSSEHFRAEGMRGMTGAGGLRRVGEGAILDHRVEVTDLPTQKRIAAFLDRETARIDALIEKKQRLVQLSDERLAGRVALLFQGQPLDPDSGHRAPAGFDAAPERWKATRLGYYLTDLFDGVHVTPTYTDFGTPFLRVTDISSGTSIDWESVRRISREEYEEITRRRRAKKGDLLLSKNGTVGIPRIVDWDEEFAFFVSLAVLRPDARLSAAYLEGFFLSPLAKSQIFDQSRQTSVINLHLEKIRSLRISVPPLDVQMKVVKQLRDYSEPAQLLRRKVTSSVDRLREYRAALITAAVTGQIDVDRFHRKGGTDRTLERIEAEMSP